MFFHGRERGWRDRSNRHLTTDRSQLRAKDQHWGERKKKCRPSNRTAARNKPPPPSCQGRDGLRLKGGGDEEKILQPQHVLGDEEKKKKPDGGGLPVETDPCCKNTENGLHCEGSGKKTGRQKAAQNASQGNEAGSLLKQAAERPGGATSKNVARWGGRKAECVEIIFVPLQVSGETDF